MATEKRDERGKMSRQRGKKAFKSKKTYQGKGQAKIIDCRSNKRCEEAGRSVSQPRPAWFCSYSCVE